MYKGERFNSISHLVGFFLAVAGVSVLLTLASLTNDFWKIFSCAVFGTMMIFLYGFSTLYHSLRGSSKSFFLKLDYTAIYLMIAGTYTPFALVTLRERQGWWLFSIIWLLAIFGIIQELFRVPSAKRKLSLFLYLMMGWIALFFGRSLWTLMSPSALVLLVLGGIFYTAGVLFFIKSDEWLHSHGIWHLFVIAGSMCHYFCVLYFVM